MLKAYQELLDYEQIADEDWNKVSQAALDRGEFPGCHPGDYRLTPEEMAHKLEVDLINMINRAPKGAMEAADKGTAFNEIVDCLIENRGSSREDCTVRSIQGGAVVRAEINGFTFDFDTALCKEVASRFAGSLPQYLVSAVMETGRGPVELYGYIDEWVGSVMYDIKTTKSYEFGNYGKGWQHYVYPWAAIESGLTREVERFDYVVVEWAYQKKGEPLRAKNIYTESYDYDHARSTEKLRDMAEHFIDWLESRRQFIKEPKIFGGERPADYKGKGLTKRQREKLKPIKAE